MNVLDPKVALFFLAFLPQFVEAGPGAAAGMAAIGITYAALTMAYLGTVAVLSGRVGAGLDGPGARLRYGSAAVLVALGLSIVVESAG